MAGVVESVVQCWGCAVFDRLFQVVSNAGVIAYEKIVTISLILFCALFAFSVANIIWTNIKGGGTDSMYQKTIKPLVINSLIALVLLGTGIQFPRLVSQITFEPVADMTLLYTHAMLKLDADTVNEKVSFQPTPIDDNGFFTPSLRDKIILLMKTTVTQFQTYIKLGFAIIDTSLSFHMLYGIGSLLKHLIMIFIGFYLSYSFFKLFINFCFYFADITIAMMFFAFLFPLGIMFTAFKGNGIPKWISGLGKGIGANQIKTLINSIVSLGAVVITYTIIMTLIAKFFVGDASDASGSADLISVGIEKTNELITKITQGDVFASDLSEDNLESMTITGCIVMVYIVNYLQGKIPEIASMILKMFDVGQETKLSEDVAKQVTGFAKTQFNNIKQVGKTIVSAITDKADGTATT